MRQVRKCWAVAKKDIQVYYRKGPVIIFGVLFPVFLFLAFVIGRDIPPQNLAPGLIGMALFFTASATTLTVFPFETRTRTLERLLASPLHLSTLIAGDVLAAFPFGMVLSLLPVALSLTALGAELHYPLILIAAVLLSGLCFSVLGTLLSTPATDDPGLDHDPGHSGPAAAHLRQRGLPAHPGDAAVGERPVPDLPPYLYH